MLEKPDSVVERMVDLILAVGQSGYIPDFAKQQPILTPEAHAKIAALELEAESTLSEYASPRQRRQHFDAAVESQYEDGNGLYDHYLRAVAVGLVSYYRRGFVCALSGMDGLWQTHYEVVARTLPLIIEAVAQCEKAQSPAECCILLELYAVLAEKWLAHEWRARSQYLVGNYHMDVALLHRGKPVLFIEIQGRQYHSDWNSIKRDDQKARYSLERYGVPVVRWPGGVAMSDPRSIALQAVDMGRHDHQGYAVQ